MAMHNTRNDLPLATRKAMVALLNARLADAIDLGLQLKQAHWNITGPAFIALHELLDKLYGEAGEAADLIAERARQLGGTAEGTLQAVSTATALKPYPATINGTDAHLKAVINAMATFGAAVRAAIEASSDAKDADTADIFTEISRASDKGLWFVESHLR